jgi:hypothetical protein
MTASIEALAANPDSWLTFDDALVMTKIREYARDNPSTEEGLLSRCLITRHGPKQVWSWERFAESAQNGDELKLRRRLLEGAVRSAAAATGLSVLRYWVWDNRNRTLTSIGSRIPTSHLEEGDEHESEAIEVAVRIKDARGRGGSEILVD